MHDLAPANQRPSKYLREKCNVESILDQRILWRKLPPQVRQIHDVMEGEEGDSERQRYIKLRGGPSNRQKAEQKV